MQFQRHRLPVGRALFRRKSFHSASPSAVAEEEEEEDPRIAQLAQVHPPHFYLSLLRSCIASRSLPRIRLIHAHLVRHRFDLSGPLADHLIMAFAKCGSLIDALSLFYTSPKPTIFGLTSILSALSDSGHARIALHVYFHHIYHRPVSPPDAYTFVSLLKSCGCVRDLEVGRILHHHACELGLCLCIYLANTLVCMYGKCASVEDAEDVFRQIVHQNVVSWNSILSVYVENRCGEKALLSFRQMIEENVTPNKQSFILALQACGVVEVGNAEDMPSTGAGSELVQAFHGDVYKKGLCSDAFIGTTLVSMYGKCGMISQACNAFNGITFPNAVSWNAITSAYVDQCDVRSALQLHWKMHNEGVTPDLQSYLIVIQACGLFAEKVEGLVMERQAIKVMSLEIGQALHKDAERNGVASDTFVGNTLISMYGKCGSILESQAVFCSLWQQCVVSWTAMLSALVDQQQGEKAILLYRQMQEEGPDPNCQTTLLALGACSALADAEKTNQADGTFIKEITLEIGQALHAQACRRSFNSHVFVGNSLINMYGKCGNIVGAEHVFLALSFRNVVSWTAILSSYVENNQAERALQLYTQMHHENISPDPQTFVVVLEACIALASKRKDVGICIGKALHFDAWKRGFATHIFVGSALLRMYGQCGMFVEAMDVFDQLTPQTYSSWIAVLSACIEHHEGIMALKLYRQFTEEGMEPNSQIIVMALQACGILAEKEVCNSLVEPTKIVALEIGKCLHACARSKRCDLHAFVGSTLIYMYGKCGDIVNAEAVFYDLALRGVVSWNVMITAYAEDGKGEKALWLYSKMLEEGVSPNHQTFVAALQACGSLINRDEDIFTDSLIATLREISHSLYTDAIMSFCLDLFVMNTLISVYGKCGLILDAERVFGGLSKRDIVSWNAIFKVYVEQNQAEKALELFKEMEKKHVAADDITLISILQACKQVGSLEKCRQIHFSMASNGDDMNSCSGSTLIHAYGSCSSMADARAIFEVLARADVVLYSACITGYAGEGNCIQALHMFWEMCIQGLQPDGVTFMSMLYACSHYGLVDMGIQFFKSMNESGKVNMDMKHWVGIVDLLARAGDFKVVENVLYETDLRSDLALCLSLLSACLKHGKIELGKQVFDHVVHLHPQETAPYILMSKIYSDAEFPNAV